MFVEVLSMHTYDECIIAEMEDMLEEKQNPERGSAKQRTPEPEESEVAEKDSTVRSTKYHEHRNKVDAFFKMT